MQIERRRPPHPNPLPRSTGGEGTRGINHPTTIAAVLAEICAGVASMRRTPDLHWHIWARTSASSAYTGSAAGEASEALKATPAVRLRDALAPARAVPALRER